MASFKKKQAVKFKTRHDRPVMHGKVDHCYQTARGEFVAIKATDGVLRNLRPVMVTAT